MMNFNKMSFSKIDVVIPCYNAEKTLIRAVNSVLNQELLNHLWIIDDCSTDNSFKLANQIAARFPEKVTVERLSRNGGVAKARNWGAVQSNAELIAFLDADDAYEPEALKVASCVFHFRPETVLVRLAMKPVGLSEEYTEHPDFESAWETVQMSLAGNVVFRRAFLLACGAFPQESLFNRLGGDDNALGEAVVKLGRVATLFEDVGVLYYCHEGMKAERLLDAVLFGKKPKNSLPNDIQVAEQVTENICKHVDQLKKLLDVQEVGVKPLVIERTE
ncbi:glycosyltransferase family 2 protein [Pasteurella multocida]|uniref:glycosyltransferase family 2 protein n=1 Tax=Pasteurella multocida TaxID=747 RepID=UPI00202438FB|nr:glycosyltransferase family A protein [Pasteurella multocida]URK04726.1 glycosyltransferase family 2 protein [Pasteurella multocida]URK07566.1 glycosyltransferase family 2 protein [Pasteurella multocida]